MNAPTDANAFPTTVQQTVLNVPDFSDDWRFAKNPQIAEAQMRSYAGVPLAYTIPETG